jgi:hypothetical protein
MKSPIKIRFRRNKLFAEIRLPFLDKYCDENHWPTWDNYLVVRYEANEIIYFSSFSGLKIKENI